MGTPTYLFIYSKSLEKLTGEVIFRSIKALEPRQPWVCIYGNEGPDKSWEEHLAEYSAPWIGGGAEFIPGPDFDIPQCPIDQVASYFNNDNRLTVDFRADSKVHEVIYEQGKTIPQTLRRKFEFSNCYMKFGFHDIFYPGNTANAPRFIARPVVSIYFQSHDRPDVNTFVPRVEELPAMIALKGSLEPMWGDLGVVLIPCS
jgi:hypothetical protein